ncbi:GNAT family N-acetyltransferase [Paracoccaceae bacterium Fryx2]|nr:GNAT family N-acetyltransferase [Paracoccaceae bacterium Fryx2]
MIRPACPADLPAIAAIWNPVIRETLVTFNSAEKTLADLERLLSDRTAAGQALLVAEADGALAGFATYGQFRGGVGYARCMEHTIILGEAARGRGLGRALLTAIEDHARAGGAHSIFAGVSGGNPQGRAFHAACGYAEVAVLREVGHKFGRWFDLVLMQKFLT